MIEAGNTPGWEPGKALEYFVLRAFQLEEAQVTFPYCDGLACLTECKDTAYRANIEPIAKMLSSAFAATCINDRHCV